MTASMKTVLRHCTELAAAVERMPAGDDKAFASVKAAIVTQNLARAVRVAAKAKAAVAAKKTPVAGDRYVKIRGQSK